MGDKGFHCSAATKFVKLLILYCALDGAYCSSCGLSWEMYLLILNLSFRHCLFPLWFLCLYIIVWNVKKQRFKFRVCGFSQLTKFWKLQWPLAFRRSTCRKEMYRLYVLNWNAGSEAFLPDIGMLSTWSLKLYLLLKYLITLTSLRVSRVPSSEGSSLCYCIFKIPEPHAFLISSLCKI